MTAKVKTVEPALRCHLPAHCPVKLGSVNALEDTMENENLTIVKSGGFELISRPTTRKNGLFKCGTMYYGYKQELLVNLELSYRL